MQDLVGDLKLGWVKGRGEDPLPLLCEDCLLTGQLIYCMIHRRGGGMPVPPKENRHADSHKYCPLGRCGTRPGPYEGGSKETYPRKKEKIIAWRKAKAYANRAYLEEMVYAKTISME